MRKKVIAGMVFILMTSTLVIGVNGEENIVPDIGVVDDLAYVEPWEELTINNQYSRAEFEGIKYDFNTGEMNEGFIEKGLGEKLGIASMTGWDEINGTKYSTDASIYEIKDISTECAVAIQFNESDKYYVYYNAYYRPDTLGEFIEDLNLTENLVLGAAHYRYLVEERPLYQTIVYEEYEDFDDYIVWEMLLDNRSAPNIDDGQGGFYAPFTMSVNIPILGIENISMGLTDEGYLKTNIMSTAKIFVIGEGKAEKFINLISEM